MTDKEKSEQRYKWTPIVATATRVGQVKGKDVLKIDVPIEEDAKTIKEAAKRDEVRKEETEEKKRRSEVIKEEKKKKQEEEREKEEAKKDVTNILGNSGTSSITPNILELDNKTVKETKESKDNIERGKKMEDSEIEAKVDNLVQKRLSEIDIQKTIKDIGLSSVQTERKVKNIEVQLSNLSALLEGLVSEQKGIKEGLEGELSETKNDVTKYGKQMEEKIEHVHQKVGDIEKKIPDKVLCSGEKGCNSEIEVGSSFCPNCGRGIDKWEDMPDWVPYSERK